MKRLRNQLNPTTRSSATALRPQTFDGRAWLVLLLIVLFIGAIRVRLAGTPLERDEGEYAYAGQLILQGIPPYKLVYNMKLPGTYGAYALLMAIFGQTPSGIHFGLAFVNAATMILMFLLGRRMFGTLAGLATAATYGLMATSTAVYGIAAHANHFVVFFAVIGLLMLRRWQEAKSSLILLSSGLAFGTGFLMKQQGVFFCAFAALVIAVELFRSRAAVKTALRDLLVFGCASLLPFALTCVVLWTAGVFPKFWFWTFVYAKQYTSVVKPCEAWPIFKESFGYVWQYTWPLLIAFLSGLVFLVTRRGERRDGLWITALLGCSILAFSVGFYFRLHYYILLLPALALAAGGMIGCASEQLKQTSWRYLPAILFFILFAGTTMLHAKYFFKTPPTQLSRDLYPNNPFTKAEAIADFIQKHSGAKDSIAVIGSEPELYFLSHRHSATGFIYTYGLMEPQPFAVQMQKDMTAEIGAAQPAFLVVVNFQNSWLMRPDSNKQIFEWTSGYANEHYHQAGLIDWFSDDKVMEYWGDSAASRTPTADDFILIFQRNNS